MSERFCYYCPAGRYVRKRDRRTCVRCSVNLCERHGFIRVDESNESITRNGGLYCANCAEFLEPSILSLLPPTRRGAA